MQIRSSFAVVEPMVNNTSTDELWHASTNTTTTIASQICLDYLGSEDVCINESINTLLRFKHQTSIHTCFIVSAMFIQVWGADNLLQKLNALFVICPMGMGIISLYISMNPQYGVISNGVIFQLFLLCIVLSITTLSGWSTWKQEHNHPRGTGKNYFQTLPNLCLIILFGASLYDAIQLIKDDTGLNSANSIIQVGDNNNNDLLQYWYAAKPIVYFIANDKITNSMIYAYAWYFLNDYKQCVS